MSLGEEVRREIQEGADKMTAGAHNLLVAREDVGNVLSAMQQMMVYAQAANRLMDPAFEILKKGYVQAATAGEGTRDQSPIRESLDGAMPIMDSLNQQRVAVALLIEAAEDFAQVFGSEQYPIQLEADAIAAGSIAVRLHAAAQEL